MSDNYYSDSTNTNIIPIIRVGEVITVKDTTKSGRIKVSITGVDDLSPDGKLIDCVPLLPKYLVTLPKVGECVFVFQYENKLGTPTSSFNTKRFWIGPLITQPTTLEGENYNKSLSILPDGYTKLKDPNIEPGVYGNDDDIVLQGRYNTDIIQKDRQIWIRTGKFIDGNPKKFNRKDIGYIQLKYGGEKLKKEIINKKIVTKIKPLPKTNIKVKIDTITAGSPEGLRNDAPPARYKQDDVIRTDLFIRITDIKTGDEKSIFEEQFNTGTNSREDALKSAQNYINNQGLKQYQIKSDSIDLIKIYKGSNGIATSNDLTPREVVKNVPDTKLIKNEDKSSSVVNVVANKINLLSHDGPKKFELSDPEGLITDDEQEKINNESQSIVYGDKLVEFLELVQKYVKLHVHPYNGIKADPSTITTDVTGFELDTLLNKNIKSI
tara:strand:- start:38 stop:1348 length:1311 start_codon:yes stop_codon:yes gene_type:complete